MPNTLINLMQAIGLIAPLSSTVQDMPSHYFALLNKAMAVEECDATKAQLQYYSLVQKNITNHPSLSHSSHHCRGLWLSMHPLRLQ